MLFVPLAAVTDGIATRLQCVDTLTHLSRQVTNCLVVAGDACGLEQRWIGGEACMCVWAGWGRGDVHLLACIEANAVPCISTYNVRISCP